MSKAFCLVRVQLWAVLRDMLSIGQSKNKQPKVLYGGVALFVVLMSGLSFFYSYMVGFALKMFNSLELLPSLMMSATSILVLITTMFKVKGTLFGFRDYDMVMALPVSTGAIVASRLIIFYALNFVFVLIMMVPMIIAYGILAQPGALFYIYSIVGILFVPLLPIAIASVIGTLIAYLSSKLRYSNIINIVFYLLLMVGIMGLSFTMENDSQELVNMSKALTDRINRVYPLAKMYTLAVTGYDIYSFLMFLLLQGISFVLFVVVVRGVFKKLNTLIMTGRARSNYRIGELKTSSPLKALYIKELKRYFASPLYVLNTGIGVVFLTLGAVALFFVDLEQILGGGQEQLSVMAVITVFTIFCINMTSTTMASISLEGKNLWIVKSMPVDSKTIFLAKIAVNLTVLSPVLIDVVLLGLAIKPEAIQLILITLIALVCSVYVSFFGLLMNLLMPNLNWSSEVVVVKQSVASLVTVFAGFGFVGIQVLLLVLLPESTMANLCFALFMAAVDVVLYRLLMTYGRRRFCQL